MFPHALATYEAKWTEQKELVASAAACGCPAPDAAADRSPRPGDADRRVIAAVLARLATLVPDSRDGLRSKDQDLATYGVCWTASSIDDDVLARELQAARLRRICSRSEDHAASGARAALHERSTTRAAAGNAPKPIAAGPAAA